MAELIYLSKKRLSCLKDKSDFNKDAAELLIDNNLYASSVHCSYYSVFQRMKYGYKTKEKLSEEAYSSRYNSSGVKNSHVFLINNFCSLITNSHERRNLKTKIKDLKTFRVESDYQEVIIDHSKSSLALDVTKEILNEIKKLRL